ncbi:MAG: hypothetical protein IJ500_04080 [Alphaproteobacteria bacterium]|nr:hypothetical protein [Alphaproteobacteria bacterium]
MYIESHIIEDNAPVAANKVWHRSAMDSALAVDAAADSAAQDVASMSDVSAEVRSPSSACAICASYDRALGCISQFKCPHLVR